MVQPFDQLSDAALIEVANVLMDKLMLASTNRDYVAHTQDFSKRALSVLNFDQFEMICEHYQKRQGYFLEREFVALFRRPNSIAVIWRQKYSLVEGDYVAEMAMIIEDGAYKVDHVFVF